MNIETPLRQTAWAALVLVIASSCGAPSRGHGDDEPATSADAGADAGPPTTCTPGNGTACTCSDGRAGQATCVADGSRYGPCLCDGTSVCEPSVACTSKECGEDGCGGTCGPCATQPATTCANATTLRTYSAIGICSAAGACSYSSTTSVCPAVTNGTATCSSGTCGGTCNAGYVPQAGQCVSAGPAPAGMALVPAGAFYMGCNSVVDTHCDSDESPYHQVTLSAFYMDKTEVTQEAYKTCVDAGLCTVPTCNWNPATTGQKPVVCVNWNESKAYCEWAGKRLPTEAEWEKAARGTDGRVYPWGNQTATCQYAVMDDGGNGCGTGDAMAVGSKPAGDSPYGPHDMAGNVWEWVSDWYGTYPSAAAQNPQGPMQGTWRVIRGGSWNYDVPWSYFRAANRVKFVVGNRGIHVGFRCARGAVP